MESRETHLFRLHQKSMFIGGQTTDPPLPAVDALTRTHQKCYKESVQSY